MYEKLFSKGKINGCVLRNRVILSPMDDTLGTATGEISQRAIEYYAAKAKGGTGLIIVGYIAVVGPELGGIAMSGETHLITLNDRHAMSILAERVHEYGAKVFCQLNHPGRKTAPEYNEGHEPVSATAMPSKMIGKTAPCHELTVDEIHLIEDGFARGAEHAFKAGCDGIEIHCGHHYLMNQFLNPVRNERTDEYGGSMENRCRIVVETVEKIRELVPATFPVTVRLPLFDGEGYEGENTLDDYIEIAKHLEAHGVDAFNTTIGSADRTGSPEMKAGWRNEYYKKFKAALHVPIYGPNEVKTPDEAEQFLEEGVYDFQILGRAHSADPEWCNKARSGHAEDIRPCISCNYCLYRVTAEDAQIRCAVNPLLGREVDNLQPMKPGEGTVIVIGAGPAGIQSAMTLTERGYHVEMYDKRDELCGSLNLANKAPNKFRMDNLVHWYRRQVEKNPNITVHLNTEITPEKLDELAAMKPHAVVLACGGQPIVPGRIPGIEKGKASFDVLRGDVKLTGKRVAVIGGGMTGLETAERLAEDGNEVIVVEMAPIVGNGIFYYNVVKTQQFLTERGATIKTNTALREIKDGAIVVEPWHGKFVSASLKGMRNINGYVAAGEAEQTGPYEIPVDCTVLSLGIRPDSSLLEELESRFENVVAIGDCVNPGRIGDATGAAFLAVKNL